MIDKDFEEMLRAVCEVTGARPDEMSPTNVLSESPSRLQHPTPHGHLPPERIDIDILDNLRLSMAERKLTNDSIRHFYAVIAECRLAHGNIDVSDFKFLNKLYPEEAAVAMILSTTKYWPRYDIDEVLEGLLIGFLREQNLQEYIGYLGEIIRANGMMDGVMLRLNLNTIVKPTPDVINVTMGRGTFSHACIPRHPVFTGQLRSRMRSFLKDNNCFLSSVDAIYQGLSKCNSTYSLEERLVSWIGYLVARTVAEGSLKALQTASLFRIEDKS